MSADKYPSIFSRQMATIVYLLLYIVLTIGILIGQEPVMQRSLYQHLFNQNGMDFVTEISSVKPRLLMKKNVDLSNRQGLKVS